MLTNRPSFKSGAASFYIVAISTLILVILAASFATAIISEIVRSSNDDLAQSAYDSAVAGVEEAKLAYANYRNCINSDPSLLSVESLNDSTDLVTCQDIAYWVQHPDGDPNHPEYNYNPCDMVAHILGRIGKTSKTGKRDEIGEVNLEQTTTGRTNNELDQAYTCVEFNTDPQSYYDDLSYKNPYRVIKLETEAASAVESITLNWRMSNDSSIDFNYANVLDNNVIFPAIAQKDNQTSIPTPATVSFQIIQTPNTGFTFSQLNGQSSGAASDHMSMFFVPTKNKALASSNSRTFKGIYVEDANYGGMNYMSSSELASTSEQEKITHIWPTVARKI